jgi:hypothetical protein
MESGTDQTIIYLRPSHIYTFLRALTDQEFLERFNLVVKSEVNQSGPKSLVELVNSVDGNTRFKMTGYKDSVCSLCSVEDFRCSTPDPALVHGEGYKILGDSKKVLMYLVVDKEYELSQMLHLFRKVDKEVRTRWPDWPEGKIRCC